MYKWYTVYHVCNVAQGHRLGFLIVNTISSCKYNKYLCILQNRLEEKNIVIRYQEKNNDDSFVTL